MPLIRSRTDKPGLDRAPEDARAAVLSGSPDQRWAAARFLAETPSGAPTLAGALAVERDSRVREAIFTGLARIATPQSAQAVLPYVRSDDASLRTGALDALRIMPDATRPHLKSLLEDSDADVRLLACDLVRGQPAAEAMRLLIALLETDPEPNVCAAAVDVLAEVGDSSATPSLLNCAERFRSDPFLDFAIRHVVDRLREKSPVASG